jgi:hypothetical protein
MSVRLATVGTSFQKIRIGFVTERCSAKKNTSSGSSLFEHSIFSKAFCSSIFLNSHIENCGTSPLRHKTA